jgi:hypothetical protein
MGYDKSHLNVHDAYLTSIFVML